MRKPKVLIDFSRYTDMELDQAAAAIVVAMTGNANFATPVPSLASVTTINTAFQNAMANAANDGEAATVIKNQRRLELEALLRALGLYVEVESDGDEAIMLSSGFKVSKQPAPIGPLPKPTGFEVRAEGKGEIELSIDKIEGAKSYQWEYKLVTGSWNINTTTKAKLLLTGLTSWQEYTFRVVPIGTSEVREYSDEINSYVL